MKIFNQMDQDLHADFSGQIRSVPILNDFQIADDSTGIR
jgi:hypothetical protein